MQKEYKFNRTYYIKESRKWLTTLNELRVENVRLKNQLSEAVSRKVSLDFVEEAERFQQCFVEKDQVIDLLRHDINTLMYELSEQEIITDAAERQCVILEKDTAQLIFEFRQMKISFNDFLTMGSPS